jgi:mannose-6-phosphate isomerase-like protein (cupin superfamily)
MVDKINLLDNTLQDGAGVGDHSIPIVPKIPGVRIDYEYEIELKSMMDFRAHATEAKQEILYFLAGTGILKIGGNEEALIKGDRVIVTPDEKYLVINTGDKLLHFLLIGISFKD